MIFGVRYRSEKFTGFHILIMKDLLNILITPRKQQRNMKDLLNTLIEPRQQKKPLTKTQHMENNATVLNFVASLLVFAFLLAVIIYSFCSLPIGINP